MPKALFFCLASLGGAVFACAGGFDSGGGGTEAGELRSHGSLGSPFAATPAHAGGVRLRTGLIEVLYPTTGDPAADLDGNGLPDQWEREHFGHTGIDPSGDTDGDGADELLEYLAGTDPQDRASVFRPELSADEGGGSPTLSFDTTADRGYRIWSSDDLVKWTLLETIAGTGNSVERLAPPDPETGRIFLRVEIFLP